MSATSSSTARIASSAFGPSLAAVVLIVARRGWTGLRFELAEQWRWRFPFTSWALILFAPAAIVLIAIVIAQGIGAPDGQWNDTARDTRVPAVGS